MEHRQLGNSGFFIPNMMLGTATFGGSTELFRTWGETKLDEAKQLIKTCMDFGCNAFDTADCYSIGDSELILGEALKDYKRESIIISTKTGMPMGDGVNEVGTSRAKIIKSIEASLKRLQTDYIDIYHLHCYDAKTPHLEALQTLNELVKQGKILYFAVSNYSAWHLMKMLSVADSNNLLRPVAHQAYYSLAAREFENELNDKLSEFNNIYFNSLDYKKKVRNKEIDSKIYGKEKESEFLITYNNLIEKYHIKLYNNMDNDSFIYKWFIPSIIDELEYMNNLIKYIDDIKIRNILQVILSRTMRSCRATTHSDLGTLLKPVTTTYYCRKHYKICKPLFSIIKWWRKYSVDTIKRLYEFNKLRTNTYQLCITGDSRDIDIFNEVKSINNKFYNFLNNKRINGIFTSPPYIGLIDYHEQHAYAYDLFGFGRNDNFEIGALSKGQSLNAKNEYINDISKVLINSKKYMMDNYDVFIVANDKYNLYPEIAYKSNMKIVNTFKRPVLNRVEKDKSAYSEIIFHLKEL